jgi:hypothetical protein
MVFSNQVFEDGSYEKQPKHITQNMKKAIMDKNGSNNAVQRCPKGFGGPK